VHTIMALLIIKVYEYLYKNLYLLDPILKLVS